MIVKRTILGLIGLLLLVSSAAALDLSSSTISTPGWIIANGADNSVITVTVMDTGTGPIADADITFSLDAASQTLGTISPAIPAKTDANGKATAVITAKTISGNATIYATISVNDGVTLPVTLTTFQQIDHNTPEKASFDTYPTDLMVGSETRVNLTVYDYWNNRVDNRNIPEAVRITVTGDNGVGLKDGAEYVTEKTYYTDAEGNVSIDLRLSTVAGENTLWMDPIGNMVKIPSKTVVGIAEEIPWYIEQTSAINTEGTKSPLPADGLPVNDVTITYMLTDKFGNPIENAPVLCTSSDGQSATRYTNLNGKVTVIFPAQDEAKVFTLNASTSANPSATCRDPNNVGYCSQQIEYYNTDPVDLLFTVNPQSMASLDVDSMTRAILQARVVDAKGNPVKNEKVYFSLGTTTYDATYIGATDPVLAVGPTDAVLVGDDGYATTEFSPGAFAAEGQTGFDPTATGQVVVTASWTNTAGTITKSRDILLVWKNYPYLSTYSSMKCDNAHVGDQLNLTIQLKGDGAALKPNPIDVVLTTDRSGSMMEDNPDRMVNVMAASAAFVDEMGPNDKIGVVSFGNKGDTSASTYTHWAGWYGYWYEVADGPGPGIDKDLSDDSSYKLAHYTASPTSYLDYATVDQELTSDPGSAKSAINSMVPSSGTPLRDGLRKAVQELKSARTRSGAIKAIILLSDGDYNYYGDPLARGTGYSSSQKSPTGFGDLTTSYMTYSDTDGYQSMAAYASHNGIKIYSIAFGESISSGGKTTLETLATTTGGRYFEASSANIEDVYIAIAGDLQETAGGDTEVLLDFGTVTIDDNTGSDITQYMDYVYEVKTPVQDSSTYINKSNVTKYGVFNQLVSNVQDDTASWSARQMHYDVGTIKLNETWSATLRLKLTKAGSFDLFGPASASAITFTDMSDTTNPVTQTAFIPEMQCKVYPVGENPGYGTKTLQVSDLSVTTSDPTVWKLAWKTSYDGDKTVTETLQSRMADGAAAWQTLPGGITTIDTQVINSPSYYTLSLSDTSLWVKGKCYEFRVIAQAEDTDDSVTQSSSTCISSSGGTIYIKLE
ncbi:invasin domain 3-containing protein [Methanoregula sp.]|uniref:Ig-like domain-containing protein n=1 Tax=Methanoregula sp. TaxID=2052170 RepID=UPI0025F5AEDC|nr:invasin domain 3-containing protein [Methanoregula sp.]